VPFPNPLEIEFFRSLLEQRKSVEQILKRSPNGTAQNGIGRRRYDPLSCGRNDETELSNTPARELFSYARSPITGPQFQSASIASCSYLQVLGSPTCPCKYLKTLVIHTLKRLASAVQLRPWPPYFQRLSSIVPPGLAPIGSKIIFNLRIHHSRLQPHRNTSFRRDRFRVAASND